MAHQIGLELCNIILKDEYEFILSTHIDKGHIHNHIIFNNVNMVTGKCYQSNKRSYHQIRYQSDRLCKKIVCQSLTNTTKDLRKSIKLTASPGTKMSKLRMVLLGKASFSLTLIE